MLVRSDHRSSIDLPKNNNRGVMGIKGLCQRHNKFPHFDAIPNSLHLQIPTLLMDQEYDFQDAHEWKPNTSEMCFQTLLQGCASDRLEGWMEE